MEAELLVQALERNARQRADRPALIDGHATLTYTVLWERSGKVASGLHKLGIRAGDRVVFSLPNDLNFPVILAGVLRAGAVAVPLATTLRSTEIRQYVTDVAPRAIIADESSVNEVMSAGPHSAPVFVAGKHLTARPLETLLSDAPLTNNSVTPEALALISYTSGITSKPKAAMLSHGNLAANVAAMIATPNYPTGPNDVVLGVLPFFHIYGLNVVLGLTLTQGGCVAVQDRFDVITTMEVIERAQVSVLPGTPPMFSAWLKLPTTRTFDLSKVRFAVTGASASEGATIEDFSRRFGIQIWEGYGLTEAGPAVTTTRMDRPRAESVGKALPGVELQIVDGNDDETQVGDPGEIWVRGPSVFSGYWGDEDATSRSIQGDWLRTNDMGYLDEDGYLFLLDRTSDIITVSGFNVYPREVEDALRTHPSVADVAVVGVPHESQGDRVKAFVVPTADSEVGEKDLIVYATQKLARFKVPSAVEFVDDLPRHPSGKVLKQQLA